MAEDEDKSSKTEEPTERKLTKAREQGNVPKSKEVNNLFALLAMVLVLLATLPFLTKKLMEVTGTAFAEAGTWRAENSAAFGEVTQTLMQEALWGIIPTFIVLVVLGLFGGIIQTGPIISHHPILPKLSKISLIKGMERLFSIKSLAEFLKTLFKMAVIGVAIYMVLHNQRAEILVLSDKSVMDVVMVARGLIFQMVLAAIAVMVILAVIDFIFQRSQFMKEQRMSRREIKDEYKESEGDPHIKARQRQIRQERAQRRMMEDVPSADVVITNPTHFSVALRYNQEMGDAAPRVVAKGVDHLAMRIRELAEENEVPLYEAPPLARQLYKDVEIGDEIPLDLYETVAKIIAYVFGLKKKKTA